MKQITTPQLDLALAALAAAEQEKELAAAPIGFGGTGDKGQPTQSGSTAIGYVALTTVQEK